MPPFFLNRWRHNSRHIQSHRWFDVTLCATSNLYIYIGENEIVNQATSEAILNNTKKLLTEIRERLPYVPIIYVAMKLILSREKYLPIVIKANHLIRDYIATQKNMILLMFLPQY